MVGRSDYDFMPWDQADAFRRADLRRSTLATRF